MQKASGKYQIKITDPKWKEMYAEAEVEKWISVANTFFKNGKSNFDFALFLLGENSNIYPDLKMHSLCTNGYVSQVVKADTLYDRNGRYNYKNIMGICSKILLQINAKLGGTTYKIELEKPLSGKRIMVVGVDSSRHRDRNNYGTGIAMVATINDSLTDFYNETKIIKENDFKDEDNSLDQDKYISQFHFYISKFIEKATKFYEKNNKGNKPDWIIIYRQ